MAKIAKKIEKTTPNIAPKAPRPNPGPTYAWPVLGVRSIHIKKIIIPINRCIVSIPQNSRVEENVLPIPPEMHCLPHIY